MPPVFKYPSTVYPPPNIPPGYGTELYPVEYLNPATYLRCKCRKYPGTGNPIRLVPLPTSKKIEQKISYSKKLKTPNHWKHALTQIIWRNAADLTGIYL